MARILIRYTPNPAEGTVPDDFISAIEDTQVFGRNEDIRVWLSEGRNEADFPPDFSVLDIPGMPLSAAQRGISQQWRVKCNPGDACYDPERDEADNYEVLGPKRWQLGKQDRLPPALANKLDRDRYLVITYDKDIVNNYVIDRNLLDVLITDTPIDP